MVKLENYPTLLKLRNYLSEIEKQNILNNKNNGIKLTMTRNDVMLMLNDLNKL